MGEHSRHSGLKPYGKGVSGNPGGRPSIKKAVEEACGKSTAEVTAEMFRMLYDAAHRLDPGDENESASWRFSVEKILGYIVGKPRDQVDVNIEPAMTPEEYKAEIAEIVREEVAAMSPEERIKLLVDPAPTHTIQ